MAFSDGFNGGGVCDGGLLASGQNIKSPQQEAADILKAATDKGISFVEEATAQGREDLLPFAEAGAGVLPGLQELITDPMAQKEFVTDNPFFKALAEDAQRRIFGSGAAVGKFASGGTAEALQNSILLLGEGLVGRNISKRQNLANMGLVAAGGRAEVGVRGAEAITDLIGSGASAEAAGVIGTAQARAARKQSRTDTILSFVEMGIKLSDRREKEFITPVGKTNGIPYYFFKYKGDPELRLGTIAQEVEHIEGAVINLGGRKYVDYSRLH